MNKPWSKATAGQREERSLQASIRGNRNLLLYLFADKETLRELRAKYEGERNHNIARGRGAVLALQEGGSQDER
jgi:hypothetical protein